MQDYQRDLIEFSLEHNLLRLGEFALKSGDVALLLQCRTAQHGGRLAVLDRSYAAAIERSLIGFELLLGPSRSIASAAAVQLAEQLGRDVPGCFNGKEPKDYSKAGSRFFKTGRRSHRCKRIVVSATSFRHGGARRACGCVGEAAKR
jgi:orotate phosphoribosyltransferase